MKRLIIYKDPETEEIYVGYSLREALLTTGKRMLNKIINLF